ncbi:MAG: FUSC family protein [Cyanobacteriota bacterium]|nr:FUSC family protein [Cyanobacteriota bacterium]
MITRPELRLALTTGLINGLASLSPLPFGYYAPMAVLAVSGGTYGNALELGRQRLLGSLLGMVVLLISLRGLQALPMPLGIACALGAMRLVGGALGLRVGYKVGGMIVVMGWLAHGEQLGAWVPLRLFWTVIGILASLLSVTVLWPSRGRAVGLAALAEVFAGLAEDLEQEARAVTSATPSAAAAVSVHGARQAALQRFRALLPALATELGDQPSRHPAFRLVETLEEAASRLLGACRSLSALPLAREPELLRLQQAEAALLETLAHRLRLWSRALSGAGARWPATPAASLTPPPPWQAIEAHFSHPDVNALPPLQLQRLAARLSLCRQALQAVEAGERGWAALRPPSAP